MAAAAAAKAAQERSRLQAQSRAAKAAGAGSSFGWVRPQMETQPARRRPPPAAVAGGGSRRGTIQIVRAAEPAPPPLRSIALALGAGALVRGLLLPYAVIAVTEAFGWASLCTRIASCVSLGIVATIGSSLDAMRVTLLVALAAACIGVAGGLTDSTPLLTLATLISTFGFAALPLSQSIVLAGEVSPADAAAKLGLLSVVDATASAAGVQIGFVALGDIAQYGDGSRLTAASCAVAAAVGLAGWLALQSEDVKASRTAPPTRPYSYEPERPQVIAAAVLALSAAVAMPSALVQRSLDQTFDSPMWLERTVEGVMRAAVQGVASPR